MFQLLHDWRYIDFQTGHFADLGQFKVDIHLANFGQVTINPICFILLLWTAHSYFTEFGQDIPRKTIQKIPQSINRLKRFSLLFFSVTCFSDFCDKIKHL